MSTSLSDDDDVKSKEEYTTEHVSIHSVNTLNTPNNTNRYTNIIKQNELLKHVNDLKEQYSSQIESLELSLDNATRENDAFSSQISALKQHNEYLRQASNQWHTRYNDCKISLLTAKEEISEMRTEVTNLQILYNEDVTIQSNKTAPFTNHDSIQSLQTETLKKYITENKQIKQENITYLSELKEINNKHREMSMNYDTLNTINLDLQNELNIAKVRINELDHAIHEYFLGIRGLEHENTDLKQTLSDVTNSGNQPMFDSDGNIVQISYYNSESMRTKMRTRSMSLQSNASIDINSPLIHTGSNDFSAGIPQFLTPNPTMDPYDNNSIELDNTYDNSNKDKMERLYDLYQAMHDCLFEISECVCNIKTIHLYKNRNRNRSSKSNQFTDDSKDEFESSDGEDIGAILDSDEEQKQLSQIQDITERLRECVSDHHRQQGVIMEDEKVRYTALDKTHKRYQIRTAKRIKELTRDVYKMHYRKYDGYKHICWEMIGNLGNHTKRKIIQRLTN